jgi:peptide-methionine (S)-S-oxide reductase
MNIRNLQRTLVVAVSLFVATIAYAAETSEKHYDTAIFAGGCFWCVESDFDKVTGVVDTTSGYIGGDAPNPTYKQVSAGGTGYLESVRVKFDPSVVSYAELLNDFWHSVDPTDNGGQFCDRGSQYKTAIFYLNDEQKRIAEESKAALEKSKPFSAPIVTDIRPAKTFYPAEEYHQNYYEKNPLRYRYYRFACGRDARVEKLWGKAAH